VRHLVIAHDLAILAVGPERPHASGLEGRSSGIIDLEVEDVIGDQGKERVARIDANAAKTCYGRELVGARDSTARGRGFDNSR